MLFTVCQRGNVDARKFEQCRRTFYTTRFMYVNLDIPYVPEGSPCGLIDYYPIMYWKSTIEKFRPGDYDDETLDKYYDDVDHNFSYHRSILVDRYQYLGTPRPKPDRCCRRCSKFCGYG